MTTSNTEFDIQEKTDILIKSAFGFPSTNENKAWFLETAIPANNYVVGDDILIESIPSNTDICFNTILDASDVGLTSSDFLDYSTSNITTASIVKDSTGVLIRFKKLILEDITGGSFQSWYKINSNINQDQLIPSGTNLLQNSLQFNTKQVGADQPYLYSVFKTKDNSKLGFGTSGGNWFIDNKNGVLFFTDYSLVSSDINSTHPPALTITTYIGKKGLSNLTVSSSSGGGGGVGTDGVLTVSGDIVGLEDLELNAGIIIQDDYLLDTSATRLFPDARFDNIEVRNGMTVYGDISTNNFNVVKNVTFSGDITSDTLNTANIIQFDQTGTTLNIDLSGDVYRNSITTFGNIDAGGMIIANGDISANGNLSVLGTLELGTFELDNLNVTSINASSGNVGIGTDNPNNATLHVEGNFHFSGGNCKFQLNNTGNITHFSYGTNGDNYIRSNNNSGKVVIQDTGGNVGIGTNSPSELLHIHKPSNSSTLFKMTNDTSTSGFIIEQSSSTDTYIRNTESNGGVIFHAGNTERMRIDSAGNVGIGTDTPGNKLDIHGSDTMLKLTNTSSGGRTTQVFKTNDAEWEIGARGSTNGTAPSSFYIYDTNYRMVIDSAGNVGIGTNNPGTLLSVGNDSNTIPFLFSSYLSSYPPLLNVRDSNYDDSSSIAHFSRGISQFQMASIGFFHRRGTGDILAMYTSSGNVYFGNWSRDKYIRFNTSGQIAPSTNFSTYYSDDRIKYNETDISNCLGIVRQLNAPQRYERFIPKDKNDQIQAFPTDASWNEVKLNEDIDYYEEIGFIAQEIKQIPELAFSVTGDEYDASGNATPLTLDYGNIHNITTGAVKELDAIVQQQQAAITALEARIAALENPTT